MKHVFPTSEIAHKWAHQTQYGARNPQGNLYFRGATLYSYRDSFPIAKIFKKKAETMVLHASDTYSLTTSGHCYGARRASSHLPCVTVPYISAVLSDHAQNVKFLVDAAAGELAKAQRMMRSTQWRRDSAAQALADAQAYSKFFGIRRKVPAFPAELWTAAAARVERIQNPDPVRDAAKFRAKERRTIAARALLQGIFDTYCTAVAAYNAKIAEARAALPQDPAQVWRDTGKWPAAKTDDYPPQIPWKVRHKVEAAFTLPAVDSLQSGRGGAVLLRVNGEQIETSQGARIPLDHAPRIWRLVQAVLAAGRPYTRNGHTERAGEYAIDAVSVEGELRAGCHVIPYSELKLLADSLGL